MRKALLWFPILVVSLSPESALAEPPAYEALAHPVPSAVSGTLAPLVVAIDGQKVLSSGQELSDLLLNGASVSAASGQPHRPFFARSEADVLSLGILEVRLPRLVSPEVAANELRFAIEGEAAGAQVDGKEAKAEGGSIYSYPIPDESWYLSAHLVDLLPREGKPGRSYEIELEKLPPSSEIRIGAGYGGSPDGQGWGLAFAAAYRWSGSWVAALEYRQGGSHFEQAPLFSTDTQAWSVGGRVGRRIFRDRRSWLDFRRLEAGALLGWVWSVQDFTSSTTTGPPQVFTSHFSVSQFQFGGYLFEEPLRISFLGLGLEMRATNRVGIMSNPSTSGPLMTASAALSAHL